MKDNKITINEEASTSTSINENINSSELENDSTSTDFILSEQNQLNNPINAKIIEIIQNLITIVDSAQPFFSK